MLDIHLKLKALTPVCVFLHARRLLDIHLKLKALTPLLNLSNLLVTLDIHLKLKALTPYKLEQNESQLFITKIKRIF